MPSARSRAPIRRPNETNASTSACLASSRAIPVDDVAVDLDDRRAERGDEREARVAGPGVVDGEPEPGPAQGLDRALERHDVGDGLLLRALERDLARLEDRASRTIAASGPASNRGSSRLAGVKLMASRSVRLAGRRGAGARARPPARGSWRSRNRSSSIERSVSMAAWHDRRDRLRQHRHVRPEQALVLVQLAGREVDDRLERDAVQRPQAEEVVERLGLDDLGRLGHPDPLGQPGHLDGRGERGRGSGRPRAARRRSRRGRSPAAGSRRPRWRALRSARWPGRSAPPPSRARGRAIARRDRRQAVHEPDVARPEQAFLVDGVGWRRGASRQLPEGSGVGASEWRRRSLASCRDDSRNGPVRGSCDARYHGSPGRLRPAPSHGSGQAFAGPIREVEAVLRRRQRAGPARVERARWLGREVEVEDERARSRRVAAEISRSWPHRPGSARRRRSRCRWSHRGTG